MYLQQNLKQLEGKYMDLATFYQNSGNNASATKERSSSTRNKSPSKKDGHRSKRTPRQDQSNTATITS